MIVDMKLSLAVVVVNILSSGYFTRSQVSASNIFLSIIDDPIMLGNF